MTRDRLPEATLLLLLLALLAAALALATPARAAATISVQGYRLNGSFTPLESGGSMPLGAVLEIRVWVDLYSCDPVGVNWGDGSFQYRSYGGSFAQTWTHTYNRSATFTIQAGDYCSGTSSQATITVGGMGNLIDPSNPMFFPTVFGGAAGLGALAAAGAGVRLPGRPSASPPGGPKPVPRPRLRGIPYDWMLHHVSYRDIPVGAPRQPPPTIQVRPGEPTDLNQRAHCPWCNGDLGWVAGGWFCLNPGCPRRAAETRIVHGL